MHRLLTTAALCLCADLVRAATARPLAGSLFCVDIDSPGQLPGLFAG